MNADAGAFRALAAEVAAMRTEMASFTEAVSVLKMLDLPVAAIYQAGRSDERQAILAASGTRRTRRARPGHLRLAGEGGGRHD